MFWACVAKGYKSPLIRVNGRLTAQKYQELLTKANIFENLASLFGKNGYVFKEDGTSCHRERTTKEYLLSQCLALLTYTVYSTTNTKPMQILTYPGRRILLILIS